MLFNLLSGIAGAATGGASTQITDKIHEAQMREVSEERKKKQLQAAKEDLRAEVISAVKTRMNKSPV